MGARDSSCSRAASESKRSSAGMDWPGPTTRAPSSPLPP